MKSVWKQVWNKVQQDIREKMWRGAIEENKLIKIPNTISVQWKVWGKLTLDISKDIVYFIKEGLGEKL